MAQATSRALGVCARLRGKCAMSHEDLTRKQEVEGPFDRSFGLCWRPRSC
jgi:hypothetical protein